MKEYSVIGKRLPRIDGRTKVTGEAKYSADIRLSNMLYGKILRSPYPHAKILNINTSEAERLPGVQAVITSQDFPKFEKQIRGMDERAPLATDKVRFIGDEVAAVAAINEEVAEKALSLIKVDYAELPAVLDPEEAMKPDAPRIHDHAQGNIVQEFHYEAGDIDKGFRESEYISEERFETVPVHPCYLEPVTCLALFDVSGKLTMWTGCQFASGLRLSLAKTLDIKESKVRIIEPYLGGAFGGKIFMRPIHSICALLAMKTNRPVKMINSREEEFETSHFRLPVVIEQKIGIKKDGTLIARYARIIGDNGAYLHMGPIIMSVMANGPEALYTIPNTKADGKLVYTNKVTSGAMRGYALSQAMFSFETQLDMIAKELGIDPVEIRLKNIVKTGDVTNFGHQLTSCGISECIQKVVENIGWKEKKEKKQPQRGVGIACVASESDVRIFPGFAGSVAFIKIHEDGRIKVISGENESGEGIWNVFAQIAAEELGVPIEDVEVTQPDTDLTPFTMGPFGGGRYTVSAGHAVRLAAEDARKQLFEVAAEMLEANVEDLTVGDRKVYVKGSPEKGVAIGDVAKRSVYRRNGSLIIGKGIDEPDLVEMDLNTGYGDITRGYTFAAHAAEVEVDVETGKIKLLKYVAANDVGKAINPVGVEGQMEGGLAIGIGYTLTERIVYEKGKVLNPDFSNYKICTALDMPEFEEFLVESNEPRGPYGAKAASLQCVATVAPTIVNAIYDATGVMIKELPITPDKILKQIKKDGKGNASTKV